MKWRYFLIIMGCYLLNLNTILAQVRPNDDQQTALFLQVKKLATQTPVTETQVRETLEKLGYQYYSSDAVNEITRLLQQKLSENELYERISRLVDNYGLTSTKVIEDFKMMGNLHQYSGLDSVKINNTRRTINVSKQQVVIPVREDFRVNDDTGNSNQFTPAIDISENGSFVLVWRDDRNGYTGIYGQRYNSSGISQGDNFEVIYTGLSIGNPDIAIDNIGNFVVVWQDLRSQMGDFYWIHILGQRFNANCLPQGNVFTVNDTTIWYSFIPLPTSSALSLDNHGNFIVVWNDLRNEHLNRICDIFGQRYNPQGSPQGSNYKINDDIGVNDQLFPEIDIDGSSNFVVVWHDERSGNADIYGQRYYSNGQPQGSNFKINDDANSSWQSKPDIAVDNIGNFVVAWEDSRNGNYDIYIRRYNYNGQPQGSNIKINDDGGSGEQKSPAIGMDGIGNFMVVWEDFRNGNYDIYAQLFNKYGQAIRANYRVNNDSGDNIQGSPDVKLRNNFIYYTWHDTRIPGQGYDIFARIDIFNSLPVAPKLLSPPDSSFTNNKIPTLTFTVPTDTDGDSMHFKVDISTDSNFWPPIYGGPFESRLSISGFNPRPPLAAGINSCSFTVPFVLDDNIYYWRVSAYDNIDYGESSAPYKFTIDTKPPGKPLNVTINGTTHRTYQILNNKFTITWKNPADVSGIQGCYYRWDNEPTNYEEYDEYRPLSDPHLDVVTTKENSQLLYLWLKDGAGNYNFQNWSSINLINYADTPKVFIRAPSENQAVGFQVGIVADIYMNIIKYDLRFYKIDSLIESISSNVSMGAGSQLYHLWNCPLNDTSNLSLKLTVVDQYGLSASDSVKFKFNPSDQPVAFIMKPENNEFLHGTVSVKGIATAVDFMNYSIYLITQNQITEDSCTYNTKKFGTELHELKTTSLTKEQYKLYLTVRNIYGKESNDSITINIDNTPPVAQIYSPESGVISCTVLITGKVIEKNLKWLRFQYDEYDENNNIKATIPFDTLFYLSDTSFIYFWDTMKLNGYYKLRFIAEDKAGQQNEKEERFYVINNPVYETTEGLHKKQDEVSLYIPPNGYHSSVICIDKISIDKCPCDSLMFKPTDLIFEIQSSIKDSAFSKPARLTIDYSNYIGDHKFDQIQENDLRIFNYKNDKWKLVGGDPEIDQKIVKTAIHEIGIYGLFDSKIPPGTEEKDLTIDCEPRVFSPNGGGFDIKTSIIFELGKPTDVTIKIYNTAGRLISLLQENKTMTDGRNVVDWYGTDQNGSICVTGLYIVAVQVQDKMATQTVVVMNK